MYDKEKEMPEKNPWIEIGLATVEDSTIAAQISIQPGKPYPLPSIQYGTLLGKEKKFSPFLHPAVVWTDNKGEVHDFEDIIKIPSSLKKRITEMLNPHLVTDSHAAKDLGAFELIKEIKTGRNVAFLGCLKCS